MRTAFFFIPCFTLSIPKMNIAVLCASEDSIYKKYPGLNVFDKKRDARTFTGQERVIAHPPCQQWSRLRMFSKDNKEEKELAFFCLEKVEKNGGVLEHPAGSSFFKEAGIFNKVVSVDQFWFGFPARKRTYLYFVDCKPKSFPISFHAIEKKVSELSQKKRSETTAQFAEWLINCVRL